MGIFSKIFGLGGDNNKKNSERIDLLQDLLEKLIDKADLDITFEINNGENENILVEFSGDDSEKLTEKEGQLLEAIQFYCRRALQHNLPEEAIHLNFDCNGFRQRADEELIELADKLKGIALAKNKSVYFRALPPKDRKIIHQHLAQDERVKSKSVGEGLYKKIKVFPVNSKGGNRRRRNNSNRQNNRRNSNERANQETAPVS